MKIPPYTCTLFSHIPQKNILDNSNTNNKKSVKRTLSTPDTNSTNWRSERDSNPTTTNDNTLKNNNLHNNQDSNMPNKCQNKITVKCQEKNSPPEGNQIAEAIIIINQLPLTPEERANMVRLLLNNQ